MALTDQHLSKKLGTVSIYVKFEAFLSLGLKLLGPSNHSNHFHRDHNAPCLPPPPPPKKKKILHNDFSSLLEAMVMSCCHGSKFFNDNKPQTSLKKGIRTVSNFICLIQFHLICGNVRKIF